MKTVTQLSNALALVGFEHTIEIRRCTFTFMGFQSNDPSKKAIEKQYSTDVKVLSVGESEYVLRAIMGDCTIPQADVKMCNVDLLDLYTTLTGSAPKELVKIPKREKKTKSLPPVIDGLTEKQQLVVNAIFAGETLDKNQKESARNLAKKGVVAKIVNDDKTISYKIA